MNDIDKLTALVEKLQIENTQMAKIDDEDTHGIIYGVDSDDDNPTYRMAGEEDEKLDRSPKRPRTPTQEGPSNTFKQHLEKSYKEYTYNSGYLERNGKLRRNIPSKFIEKEQSIIEGILNIDCATNAEDLVLVWINKLKLLIQTEDESISNLTLGNFIIYVKYKTTGTIADWITNTNLVINAQSSDTSNESKLVFLNTLAQEIFKEFFGYGPEEARQEDKPNIIRILSNMTLCDPCYIENFFCQVKENYYKAQDRTGLLEVVLSKIPYPMAQYIEKQITDPTRKQRVQTLGLIERFAKEYRHLKRSLRMTE